MPSKSLVDVHGATDVVTRRIAPTSEDVNEALAEAFHDESSGMSRATENCEEFQGRGLKSIVKQADVEPFKLRRVRGN